MKIIRSYKGARVNSLGFPTPGVLKKNVKSNKANEFFHSTFLSDLKDDLPKNMIIMYDIPSEKRRERDWFRRHLKKFKYIMIQKSVWVGPSPLPKDFIEYVKSIGLKDKLKTFKLAKSYTGLENNI